MLDLFRWWLVIQALGLLALPLATWFFSRLPDRGYSFSKPLGLLLTGYGAWLVSMLGLGAFGQVLLWGSALLVLGLGVLAHGRAGMKRMWAELRARWGWVALQESLFALALYVGIVLRWRDFFGGGPGVSHTEQPMDLAFLSGILASSQFPPQDPWLSGYPINYYYLGYLLVAGLIRLSGVSLGVGFTLGIATIFALTACGVAGVVYNLIRLTPVHQPRAPGTNQQQTRRSALPAVFAVVAAVLVLIAGNQAGALQVLAGSEQVVALQPGQLAAAVANGVGARQQLYLGSEFPAGDFDDNPYLVPQDKLADFNAWWPSRAVWDTIAGEDGPRRVYAITEFPFFSFLLGDLHPHVLSLPWTLLAVALALNLLARSRAPDTFTRRGIGRLLLTGIVLGGLYAINSWDLPTYVLLYLGALTLLYLRLAPAPRHFFWAHYLQQAGATIMVSYLLYLPFHVTVRAPTQGFPLALAPARTDLTEFVVIFGLFAVPLLGFTCFQFQKTGSNLLASQLVNRSAIPWMAGLGLVLIWGIVAGWSLFVLLPLAVLACLAAYAQREQPATAFALWAFALGALVIWGVDVVYLRDDYGSPRMNTIFKFYYQVWLLWGTLAAYAIWALLHTRALRRWHQLLWGVPFSVLLVGSSIYPALAPADLPENRTLDGLAYLQQREPDEAAAVDWIMNNTPGSAVIVQAPGQPYNSNTARIASTTGRPTVVGWTQHERVWRGGQAGMAQQIQQREQDVTMIYTTTDPAQAQGLLEQYNVAYVYVGPAERDLVAEQNAPADALAKFDGLLVRAFEQGEVVVYERIE